MSIHITDEMREHINNALANGVPCLLATASTDGWPHISPKGSMMVYDATHLAYWERAKRASLDNLRKNPQVSVMFRDPGTRVNYRFYGLAAIQTDDGIRDWVRQRVDPLEARNDPDEQGVAVLLEVVKITDIGGRTLQEKDE